MFSKMKDAAVGMAAKRWLAPFVEDIGEIETLHIDTTAKKLGVTLNLKGEERLVRVTVGRYTLSRSGNGYALVLSEFHSTVEWVGILANKYLAGKAITIPPGYGDALEKIL
jgi:hypothetical protein